VYNNKADIFALGCIICEVLTGAKLFEEDFKIHSFATTGQLPRPVVWPNETSVKLIILEELVAKMLQIEPGKRPSISYVNTELLYIKYFDRVEMQSHPSGVPIEVCTIRSSD
jgi:serine/threonine protein kinase